MQHCRHQTSAPGYLRQFSAQEKFLLTGFQINDYSACLHSKSLPKFQFRAVLKWVSASNNCTEHGDPWLKEKASLRNWRITHKIVYACNGPVHLLMVNCKIIEWHCNLGERFRRTPHYKHCQRKDLRTTEMQKFRTDQLILILSRN